MSESLASGTESQTGTAERNPLHAYLRSLRSSASETSKALAKIDVRQNSHWPALLSHFAVVSSQLRALAEELIDSEVERDLASTFVFVPTVDNLDPARLLRVKPLVELDEESRDLSVKADEFGLPEVTANADALRARFAVFQQDVSTILKQLTPTEVTSQDLFDSVTAHRSFEDLNVSEQALLSAVVLGRGL